MKLENNRYSDLLESIDVNIKRMEFLHYPPIIPHEETVSRYMYSFAKILNINEEKALKLSFAAKFHDIGKIEIETSILNKAGPLDTPEKKKIEKHSEIGYQILKTIDHPLMQLSAIISLYHHENFDGSGYPIGLKGNAIPFECRLCSICDVYDALRTRRPYKIGFSHQDAVDRMTDKAKGERTNLTQIY